MIEAVPEGYRVIFTTHITLRNGKRIHASSYGLKAFRIIVKDGRSGR